MIFVNEIGFWMLIGGVVWEVVLCNLYVYLVFLYYLFYGLVFWVMFCVFFSN